MASKGARIKGRGEARAVDVGSTPQPQAARRGRGRPAKASNAMPPPPIAPIGIEAAQSQARGRGRPEGYHPRFEEIARAMCRLGATDFDLACEFDVTTDSIWRWRCKYPEFSDATLEGKEAFDNRAERSLAMRAVGYSYHSEKVFQYQGQIVRAQIVEHVPPDVGAIRLWLMNRRPDKWRDKSEVKLDGSDAFLKIWQAISDGTA